MSTSPQTKTFRTPYPTNWCSVCQRLIPIGTLVTGTVYNGRWSDIHHVSCPAEADPSESWSAARVPALEADLEAERSGRRELEREVESVRAGARQLERMKEGSARESEEIMGALQRQVDAANKDRDAAVAGLEAAEKEKESGKTRLKELFAKYKAAQGQHKAAQEECDTLKPEADKVSKLEAASAEWQRKAEELDSKLAAADAVLKEREAGFAKTVADQEGAAAAEKSAKEDLEGKVKRLKLLLSKLQKSSQGKDADLAALKAPVPPPKAFTVDLRIRHDGSTWCLVKAAQAVTGGDEGKPQAAAATSEEGGGGAATEEAGTQNKQQQQQQWVTEDKARTWIASGSSTSDTASWPTVIQDAFEERVVAAAAEAEAAAVNALATRRELETLSSDFAKYKARAHTALKKATSSGVRAHTALKKATSSGADDKRKDELIATLRSEQARLAKQLGETTSSLESQLSEERTTSKAKEDDLEAASEQLEEAQEQVRELQGSLRDQERKLAQLQEAEDGYNEEISALRDARDDLKSQLKAAKAQANESSCIAQRLQEELEDVARRNGDHRGSGNWDARADGGWAGEQLLPNSDGAGAGAGTGTGRLQMTGELPAAQGLSNIKMPLSEGLPTEPGVSLSLPLTTPAAGLGGMGSPSLSPSHRGFDGGGEAMSASEGGGRSVHLMAVAELERRHTRLESHVQAEVSEMRTELAEALVRVEQLSAQESLLKSTIRALETDLKTESPVADEAASPGKRNILLEDIAGGARFLTQRIFGMCLSTAS